MSMTAEQRKAWAYENLERYTRDVEISEFLDQLGDVSHLEDRLCDLENIAEDHERRLDNHGDDIETLADRLDEVEQAIPA